MDTEVQNPDKTVAAFIHLSTFSQFIFPFGNFIFPLILWTAKKKDAFVDEHGKQALNFQLSLFLYTTFLVTISVLGILLIGLNLNPEEPFFFRDNFTPIGNPAEAMPLLVFITVMAVLLLALCILYVYGTISATVKAGEGELYQYPLSINFISPAKAGINQSKNEQFNDSQNQTL